MKSLLLAVSALAMSACAAAATPSPSATSAAAIAHPAAPVAAPAPAAPVAEASTRLQAASYAPAIDCAVRTTRTRNGVKFEAVAYGGAYDALSGEYEFVLTRSGAGGSSDVSQGGPFDVAPGETQVLSESEFNIDRGARVRARLVLRDSDGVVCSDEYRS